MNYREIVINTLRERDGNTCQLCKAVFYPHSSIEVDHILPICQGGLALLGNLQLVHAVCNLRAGMKGKKSPPLKPNFVYYGGEKITRTEFRRRVRQCLFENENDKEKTAKDMGISIRTVYSQF